MCLCPGCRGAGDQVQSTSWKGDGSLLVTNARDKIVRVHDPRANSVVMQVRLHCTRSQGKLRRHAGQASLHPIPGQTTSSCWSSFTAPEAEIIFFLRIGIFFYHCVPFENALTLLKITVPNISIKIKILLL